MPIDPSIYRGIDTQFGQKLADLFNPASIAQRRAAADEQAMSNQLRQIQILQGVEQMKRAPILARREEMQYQAQQAEALRKQQELAKRQEMISQLPENQRRMLELGIPPEKVLMQEQQKPSDILAREKFEFEKSQAGKGGDINWQAVQTDQGLVQINPKTGAIRPLGISKPLPPAKQLTEGQAKATTYASQMQAASNQIQQIESGGFSPTGLKEQMQIGLAGGITNIAAPAKAQQYKQAQEQWAESFLRAKTGAAATREEVEMNRKTFFPQPGDSPEVVRQKTLARTQAERDVLNMAGAGRELATPRTSEIPTKTQSGATVSGW